MSLLSCTIKHRSKLTAYDIDQMKKAKQAYVERGMSEPDAEVQSVIDQREIFAEQEVALLRQIIAQNPAAQAHFEASGNTEAPAAREAAEPVDAPPVSASTIAAEAAPANEPAMVDVPAADGAENTFTEAEAAKRLRWKDMGQADNVRTHLIQFHDADGNPETGSGGMTYARVELYKGSKWKAYDRGGEYVGDFANVKEAKAAAKASALQSLREDGYIKDAVKEEAPAKPKAEKAKAAPQTETAKEMVKALKVAGYPVAGEIGNSYRPEVRVNVNHDDRHANFDITIERKDGAWTVQEFTVPDFTMEAEVDGMKRFRADLAALNAGQWPTLQKTDGNATADQSGDAAEAVGDVGDRWKLPEIQKLAKHSVDWLRKEGGESISASDAMAALIAKRNEITEEKANWTPRDADGHPVSGVWLYNAEARRKLDDIGWAITNLLDHRKHYGDAPRNAPKAEDAKASDAVPLSSVIEKANEKFGTGLTEADRIMTLAEHDALWERIAKGDTVVTADEARSAFDRIVRDESAIEAELQKLKNADLEKIARPNYRGEKKDRLVPRAYSQMVSDFLFLASDGSGLVSFTGNTQAERQADIRRKLAALTDEQVTAYGQRQRDAVEQRKAKMQEFEQSAADPKTIEDFEIALRLKMAEGMKFAEARMALTPEQRAEYDRLKGIRSRDERKARADQQKTDIRAAGQATDGQVIETKHTKTGEPLFVVKSAERVERDIYNQWNATAKRMGGWYSSFRGNGAVPGFQFKSRENADAFLAYLGGNVEQAKEVVQERRDAFADDKSQSAVERLTEMAERMDEKADESLGRERKANTARRARFAASAESAANAEKAMATTMRRIASAIESGAAQFLDRVRQKVQIEYLTSVLRTAKGNELRAKYPTYGEQQKHEGEPVTAETADYAVFPQYTMMRSDLASLARHLITLPNMKLLGQRILKVADDTSDAYTKFAKEHLLEVSRFGRADGSGFANFSTLKDAERSIEVSKLDAIAVPLQIKRGEYRIVLSPSEAINKGIWKGDDKPITLNEETGSEIVEKLGKLNRRLGKRSGMDAPPAAPWQFENAYNDRKRLAGMGIEQPWEFRAALREFAGLKEAPQEADKIKAMERAMVGRKNDGLDFFPTSAAVVEQMLEAADLQEGMNVLEPSAGMGHIAEGIREAGIDPDVVEMANDRAELLEAKGFNVVGRDFLEMNPRGFTYGDVFEHKDGRRGVMRGSGGMGSNRVGFIPEGKTAREAEWVDREDLTGVEKRGSDSGYDRIILNPPFSDRRDAEHVQHAYSLLRPGGRLVALMGEGVFFGQDKKAQAFRDWLEQVGGSEERLPEGSFMDPALPVNTSVNARLVVIDRPVGDVSAKESRNPDDPDPTEAARVQQGIEGKDILGAAAWIANNAPSEAQALIAGKVLESLQKQRDLGVKFQFVVAHTDESVPIELYKARGVAQYNVTRDGKWVSVWVNGTDVDGKVGTSFDTVTHELVHAATAGAIDLVINKKTSDPRLIKSVADLSRVFSAVAKHINQREDEFKNGKVELTPFEQTTLKQGNNFLKDEHELLAWAFSNQEAQQYLASIPYGNRTLWSAFVDAVRRALGLDSNQNTALAEVLRAGEEILLNEAFPRVGLSDINSVKKTSQRGVSPRSSRSFYYSDTDAKRVQAVTDMLNEGKESRRASGDIRFGTREQAQAAGYVRAYRGVSKASPFNDSETTWLTSNKTVAEAYGEEVFVYDDPAVMEVWYDPKAVPEFDMREVTEDERENLQPDEFGNPQVLGIYRNADDSPLGSSYPHTVIHVPKSAIMVVDDGGAQIVGKESRGSYGAGLPVADVARSIATFRAFFPGAQSLDIRAVATREDLPKGVRASPRAEGVYLDGRGQVFLIAANLQNQDRVFTVLTHEVVGHYGLEAMGEKYAQIKQTVLLRATATGKTTGREVPGDANYATVEAVRQAYTDYSRGEPIIPHPDVVAAEVLARMSEVMQQPTWYRAIVAKVRQWLKMMAKQMGLQLDPTLKDAEDLIQIAAARLRKPGSGGPQGGRREMATAESRTDQTNTKEFRDWFKDSKVVDASGKPLVVYHGTPAAFSEFSHERANYFTASRVAAGYYAEGFGEKRNGQVMPVYLAIYNPKILPLTDSAKLTKEEIDRYAAEGFDGVFGTQSAYMAEGSPAIAILPNGRYVTEAIPFSPTQIKSAIGNNGSFDPANPDIRESRGIDSAEDSINMEGIESLLSSDDAINEAERVFLSSFPESTWTYRRNSPTARLARATSERARWEFADDAGRTRRVESVLGPFSGFETREIRTKGLGGKEHLIVQVYGAEQIEAGLGFAPALTITVEDDGELSIYGPPSQSALYKHFAKRGWAEPTTDANGNHHETLDGGFWTKLTGSTRRQSIELLGDAHARALDWIGKEHLGLHWKRTTGATGNQNGREGAIYFSLGEGSSKIQHWLNNPSEGAKAATGSIKDWLKAQFTQRRPFMMGFLTVDQIADIYGAKMESVKDFANIVQAMDTEKQRIADAADQVVEKWRQLDSAVADQLADIMHESTLMQYDPEQYLPDDELMEDGKTLRAASDKRTPQTDLHQRFEALPEDAKKVYREARDGYANTLRQVRDALANRVERTGTAGGKIASEIRLQFDQYLAEGPYFPLARFGDFVLISDNGKPDGRIVETFESVSAREKAKAARIAEGYEPSQIKETTKQAYSQAKDGAAGQFAMDVIKQVQSTDMDEETKAALLDDLNQLAITNLPDQSYRKHFVHRKGTPGFSNDAMRAFANSQFHAAHHIAKINHADQLAEKIDDVMKEARDTRSGDVTEPIQVANELKKRLDAIVNPTTGPVAASLGQLGFVMSLGGNIASGVTNLTQTPMVTYPWLGAKFGFDKAAVAMTKASKDYFGGKWNKWSGYVLSDNPSLTDNERQALRRLQDMGKVDLTQAHDLAGVANQNSAQSKGAYARSRAMKIVGWTFHLPEVFNRQVSALAAYRLAIDSGMAHGAAIQYAAKTLDRTHFNYSSTNRARFMQGDFMRVLTMFKQFSQQMTYMLWRNTYQALKGETPEVRREARRMLAGVLTMHFMAAGSLGLPLGAFGVSTILLPMMAMGMGDEDDPWEWQAEYRNLLADTFGTKGGEVIAHGPLRAIMPYADFASRVGLGDLWFRAPSKEMEGRAEVEAWMQTLAGPVLGYAGNLGTAAKLMNEGNFQRGVEAMLPKMIAAPLKAVRFGTDGVQSMKGDDLGISIDALDVAFTAAGFNPSDVSEMYESRNAVKNREHLLDMRRKQIINQWHQSRKAGDNDGVAEALKLAEAFNTANKDVKSLQITKGTLAKSAAAKERSASQVKVGAYLSKGREQLREEGRFADVDAE